MTLGLPYVVVFFKRLSVLKLTFKILSFYTTASRFGQNYFSTIIEKLNYYSNC